MSNEALMETGNDRLEWIDIAKGIGIILVVLGHALAGLIDSPIGSNASALRTGFTAIYFFHMPLFFLLSGLHIRRRLQVSRTRFKQSLFSKIAYPYLVWSAIQFSIIYFAGNLVNAPVSGSYWFGLASILFHPGGQFWFLYSLLLCHLASLTVLTRIGASSFLLLALIGKSLTLVVDLPSTISWTLAQAPYYALGAYLGTQGIVEVVTGRPVWVRSVLFPGLAVILIALTELALASKMGPQDFLGASAATLAWESWGFNGLAAALTGIGMVVSIASLMDSGPVRQGFRRAAIRTMSFLGQKSLSIYVLHVVLIAGTRIALIKLAHISDPYVILPFAFVSGIVGALILDTLFIRFRIAKPLGLA